MTNFQNWANHSAKFLCSTFITLSINQWLQINSVHAVEAKIAKGQKNQDSQIVVKEIRVEDKEFTPKRIEISENSKVELKFESKSKQLEIIKSSDLSFEKFLPPNITSSLVLGPLKAGTYRIVNEMNTDAVIELIVR